MSAFVNVLLMTRRRRSEPVSGANVKPDLRTSETASASATENASARSDGQRDGDLRLRELGREARDERLDLRVVRRGERQEADLAPARLVDERLRRPRDVGGVQLAHGPVPVAGLAEAAALRAAAHDLEAEAVLDDVDGRDHRFIGIDVGRELLDPDALHFRGNTRRVRRRTRAIAVVAVVRHVVQRRDVDPGAGAKAARRSRRGRPRVAATFSRKTAGPPRRRRSGRRRRSRREARDSRRTGPPPMTIGSALADAPRRGRGCPRRRACSGRSCSSSRSGARSRGRRNPGRARRTRRRRAARPRA